jgi:hypothetical protein
MLLASLVTRMTYAEHGALSHAVIGEWREAMCGKRCNTYCSVLHVSVLDTDVVTYPDALVICGRLETAFDYWYVAINPMLLVEVPSEWMEAYGRGSK